MYTRSLFGVLSLALVPFMVNCLVDPLWYFDGNQFGPNYPFNERVSKANLLKDSADRFDCLILGSSRTTLLRAGDVGGRTCFNFAVSQARLKDEVLLASYARKRGLMPKTVIVALDGFNFSKPLAAVQNPMPPFILSGHAPPPLAATYLSLDATEFSLKTLLNEAPNDRYYDAEFSARALPGSGPFRPERPLKIPDLVQVEAGFNQFSLGPFEKGDELNDLRRSFPDALLLGYVPPVAAEWVAKLHLAGTLRSYLAAVYESSKHFDRAYDFSIPSSITRNSGNTYDGSHFYQNVNTIVAQYLSEPPEKGTDAVLLHEVSLRAYEERFEAAVLDYIEEIGVASSGGYATKHRAP